MLTPASTSLEFKRSIKREKLGWKQLSRDWGQGVFKFSSGFKLHSKPSVIYMHNKMHLFHRWNTTFSHCISNVSPADSPFYSNPWLKGNKNHEKRNFFRQKKRRTTRYQNCSLHSTDRKYTSIGKKPHAWKKNNQNLKTIYKLNWRQKKVCEKIVCSRICKLPPQF